jgi:hypothetical protein
VIPPIAGAFDVLELFRYSSPGQLGNGSQPDYFSIDGGNTPLKYFAPSGDTADWIGSSTPPDANDANGTLGQVSTFTLTDFAEMDVLGFSLNLAPFIQSEYLAITRTTQPLDQATAIADAINGGTQTESAFVNSLLSQVLNTTVPAVAVEGSMYGAVGTSAEITSLVTQFLPAQVANAEQYGLNPQVYGSEALGLAFAFGNENQSTTFENNFGPSNAAMPNSTAGDAAFAAAASSAIFGSASTSNLINALDGYVTNWKAFYTSHGVPGVANATADQIDLAARGAAWGDAVGVELANNLGPLNGQVINFIDDAAQGSAQYSASLIGQPAHAQFEA